MAPKYPIPVGLVAAIDASKLTQAAIADAVETSAQQVSRLMKGERKFTVEWARRFGQVLQRDPQSLLFPPESGGATGLRMPIIRETAVGDRDLPLYAAAEGGHGHLLVTFEAIDYVKRPARLERVKDAYSILVVGESMIPAFRPGDMALVHPHLPPRPDTEIILYHTPPDGEAEAIIKHLVRLSPTQWRLKQWNPAKEWAEYRQEWPICHQVVGRYNAR